MKWRKISEDDVKFVLGNPDRIEQSIYERTNAFRLLGDRFLKVTYKESEKEILVISVVDKND
jgi:hypothetical protein